jgi:hypothetical protein
MTVPPYKSHKRRAIPKDATRHYHSFHPQEPSKTLRTNRGFQAKVLSTWSQLLDAALSLTTAAALESGIVLFTGFEPVRESSAFQRR